MLVLILDSYYSEGVLLNNIIKNPCRWLHSTIKSVIFATAKRNGYVAQLNRASDYGSEGCGFESHRGHFKTGKEKLLFRFFYFQAGT